MESGQRWNSSAFGVSIPPPNEMNCFLNPNCDASTDRNDPFESALSSLVSSPTVSNAGDGFVRELIGKLGSIHNSRETSPQSCKIGSTNNSCYTTPLSSPPKLNLSSLMEARMGGKFGENQGASAPGFSPMNADPGFVERAAKFSCFGSKNLGGGFSGGQLGSEMGYGSLPKLESGSLSRVSSNNCIRRLAGAQEALNSERNGDMGDSREGSSVSEQNPGGELGVRAQNHTNSRKRKAIPRAKGPVKEEKVGRENDEPSCAKRSKSDVDAKKEKTNSDEELSGNFKDTTDQKENNNEAAKAPEPPKDYIHVRARRGQATDSHSLAERVRREKISERMKFLQDLVPGCNKVTGKAVVLDEIINYVQSLQRQVEFLSMKLATVNPRMDINMEALLSKDILQLQSNMFPDSSAPAFPYGLHPQQMLPSLNGLHGGNNTPFSVNPMDAAVRQNSGGPMPSTGLYGDSAPQIPSFWEDDLHSIVQMGFPQNEMQNFQGLIPTTQMKTEL